MFPGEKLLPSFAGKPTKVVTDSDRAEFDHPMMWMRSPVHLGDFGIEQVPFLEKDGM